MFVRHIVCDLGINDHHYKYWCPLWSIFDLFNNALSQCICAKNLPALILFATRKFAGAIATPFQ
jgi:hypothetical protein